VPETTAYNWLRDPEFSTEYKKRKRQTVAEASDFMQSKINAATKVIDELMTDTETPPQTRLSAAKTILETAYKIYEQTEIIERIEALEAVSGDTGR